MKITEISAKLVRLKLWQDFKIAHGVTTEYEGVVIKIGTDEGLYGLGEASPSKRVTGETVGSVLDVINNLFRPVLIGQNPLDIERITELLDSRVLHNTSAKAAVDIALYDILGKKTQLPLSKLLGGYKDEITTSITIGIKGIEETLEEARKLLGEGVKVIKIKIGISPAEDIEKLRLLREELGSGVTLRADANQGYSRTEAVSVLRELEKQEIEFIEQPLPWWDIEGLRIVRDKVGIPIMADESLHTIHDAMNLIQSGACDLFNIKLMKTGGISAARKIAAIAESAGIPCMLGCMVETRIGISAATHLALSNRNIKYADLDGHLYLKEDIVRGGVVTEEGVNRVFETEGLGLIMEDGKEIL